MHPVESGFCTERPERNLNLSALRSGQLPPAVYITQVAIPVGYEARFQTIRRSAAAGCVSAARKSRFYGDFLVIACLAAGACTCIQLQEEKK